MFTHNEIYVLGKAIVSENVHERGRENRKQADTINITLTTHPVTLIVGCPTHALYTITFSV